ncbi:hypothetical protein [Nitrosopumilus spindle-shaped virus]|uniref:Uncharacterized protein n=1 Tax=Nitrosopumilus spindle-shaped virus TaxID=2508184 RepID=A0A514K385_9VIRU|nr:hypothetical protein [Nitrosopumilus spindle-shaped virus]
MMFNFVVTLIYIIATLTIVMIIAPGLFEDINDIRNGTYEKPKKVYHNATVTGTTKVPAGFLNLGSNEVCIIKFDNQVQKTWHNGCLYQVGDKVNVTKALWDYRVVELLD